MGLLLSPRLSGPVMATDGAVGRLDDVYYDDEEWSLQHLVIKLRRPVGTNRVLVSPDRWIDSSSGKEETTIALSRTEVSAAPDRDQEMPVSRRRTLGLTFLWPDVTGVGTTVPLGSVFSSDLQAPRPHLRSFRTTRRYLLATSRGVLGRLEDFVLDEGRRRVSCILVRLGTRFSYRLVCAPPSWVGRLDWTQGTAWSAVHPSTWRALSTYTPQGREP